MATVQQLKSTIQLRRDLFSNFTNINPLLKAGEPAVCMPGTEQTDIEHAFELRIGDGVHKFSELPAINSIGSTPTTEVKVDSKSVIMNAEGEIALNGFSDAATNYMPYKGEDGELHWMPVPTAGGEVDLTEVISKIDANTKAITEIQGKVADIESKLIEDYYTKTEIDAKLSSAFTPGNTVEDVSKLPSPPTEADVGVIHPVENGGVATEDFVTPGATIDAGDQVVAVKQPDGSIKYDILPGGVMDISNLQEQVEKNTANIATNTGNIGANQQAIDNVRTDLLNNYYTKPEVDEKLTSIYHPAPGVDNVTDLPDPDTQKPGTTIPVKNAGTTDDKFVTPGEEIPAGSTVVVVEDSEGNKKYDVLPPATAPDLSGYATKEQLAEGLDTKISGIKAGDTALVKDSNGIVQIPSALATQLGLVRSGSESDENGVVVDSEGKMHVVNVTIDNLVQRAGDSLELDGGNANS